VLAGARRRRRLRRAVGGALTAALVVGLAFALLSPAGNGELDPIAQAAMLSSATPGYRVDLRITIASAFLRAPMVATGTGIVVPQDRAASVSIATDVSQFPRAVQALGGTRLRLAMIIDGDAVYIRFPQAIAARIPSLPGKVWFRLHDSQLIGLPGVSSLSNSPAMGDPGRVLQYLSAAPSDVTRDGRQLINGVSTTHYHAELSLARLAAGVPTPDRAAAQQSLYKLEQAIDQNSFPIDVWIDNEQRVRQIVM
jgi:hypothetical protein